MATLTLAIKSANDGGAGWGDGNTVSRKCCHYSATLNESNTSDDKQQQQEVRQLWQGRHAGSKLKSSRNAKTFPHLTPAQEAASVPNKNRDRERRQWRSVRRGYNCLSLPLPLSFAICKCVKNLTNLLSKSKTKRSTKNPTPFIISLLGQGRALRGGERLDLFMCQVTR